MVKVILGSLAIGMLTVSAHAAGVEPCIFRTYGQSVAEVDYRYWSKVNNDDGEPDGTVTGTGFLVGDRHILTANHVLKPPAIEHIDLGKFEIIVHLGSSGAAGAKDIKAKLVKADEESDLALLQIPHDGVARISLPIGVSADLGVGEALTTIGYPLSDIAVSETSMITSPNAIVGGDLKSWWQTSLALNPGNSGGPVFGSAGSVVGVAAAVRTDNAQLISYVIPIQYATGLLQDAGVTSTATPGVCRTSESLVAPLQAQIDDLKAEISKLRSDLVSYGDGSAEEGSKQADSLCPEGEYAVGVAGKAVVEAGHQVLERATVVCRHVNVGK